MSNDLNFLGLPIRRDEADGNHPNAKAMMVFAEKVGGDLVHIDSVAKGLSCGCVCWCCRLPVIARKGEVRAPHFAHSGSRCTGAETTAHILAKWVIDCEKKLWVPDPRFEDLRPACQVFQNVHIERPLDGGRPDVLAIAGERRLLVEIQVTHRVDANRRARIRKLKIPCIEIDLSRYRFACNADLIKAVLREAPRRWIYNAELERRQEVAAEAARANGAIFGASYSESIEAVMASDFRLSGGSWLRSRYLNLS